MTVVIESLTTATVGRPMVIQYAIMAAYVGAGGDRRPATTTPRACQERRHCVVRRDDWHRFPGADGRASSDRDIWPSRRLRLPRMDS